MSLPVTISKNADCRDDVIGPGLPIPIDLQSTSLIGVISAADPVKNASSAVYRSSLVNLSSTTSIPSSFASFITVSLVIPLSTEVIGVVTILAFFDG